MSTIATGIRDAIYSLITTPAFPWKTTRKVPVPPVQIGQLPALGVYLIRESMGPNGDPDSGPPSYIVDALFGINVLNEASDPGVLEGTMDSLVDQIEDTILSSNNGWFVNPNSLSINSVPTITRTYDFPKDGETQYIQCRLQMTVRFYCDFEPDLINDFDTLAVTVQPPNQSNLAGVAPTVPDNFLVELETTPPQIAITSIGGWTNSAAQTITGTALPGSGNGVLGTVYLYDAALPIPIGIATVAAGAWSVNVTLAALGERTLYAVCSDNLGNSGTSAPVIFNLVTGTP